MTRQEKALRYRLRRTDGERKRGMFGNDYVVPTNICNRFLNCRPTIEEMEKALEPFGEWTSPEWVQSMIELGLSETTTSKDGREGYTIPDHDKLKKIERKKREELMLDIIKNEERK
jgi:hypothetical protein